MTESPSSPLPPGIVLDAVVAETVFKAKCYRTDMVPLDDEYQAWLRDLEFPCYITPKGVNLQGEDRRGIYYASMLKYAIWSPSRDANQAVKIIEKMQKLGLWFKTSSPFDPDQDIKLWHGGFTPHGMTGWNGRPDAAAFGVSFPHVVCLSAVEWMENHQADWEHAQNESPAQPTPG